MAVDLQVARSCDAVSDERPQGIQCDTAAALQIGQLQCCSTGHRDVIPRAKVGFIKLQNSCEHVACVAQVRHLRPAAVCGEGGGATDLDRGVGFLGDGGFRAVVRCVAADGGGGVEVTADIHLPQDQGIENVQIKIMVSPSI